MVRRITKSALPFGAGAHRFTGTPAPLATGPRMFTFMTDAEIRRARGLPPRQSPDSQSPDSQSPDSQSPER